MKWKPIEIRPKSIESVSKSTQNPLRMQWKPIQNQLKMFWNPFIGERMKNTPKQKNQGIKGESNRRIKGTHSKTKGSPIENIGEPITKQTKSNWKCIANHSKSIENEMETHRNPSQINWKRIEIHSNYIENAMETHPKSIENVLQSIQIPLKVRWKPIPNHLKRYGNPFKFHWGCNRKQ